MGILSRALLFCGLSAAFAYSQNAAESTFTLLNWKGGGGYVSLSAEEGVLLAFTESAGSQSFKIYRSLDTGKSWRPFPLETENLDWPLLATLQFDPVTRLFYAFSERAAYVAAPTAARWTRLFEGGSSNSSVSGNTIVSRSWPNEGVNVTLDEGKTWKSFKFGPSYQSPGLLSALAAGPCAYAGYSDTSVMVSCDGGATWRRSGSGSLSRNASSLVLHEGAVYASANTGIVRTVDSGKTWVSCRVNLAGEESWNLARTKSSLLAWGWATNALLRSTDGGRSWFTLTPPPSSGGLWIEPLSKLAEVGDALYYYSLQGLLASRDGGTTWSFAPSRSLGFPIRSLSAQGKRFLAHTEQGIFGSRDSALSWDPALPAGDSSIWTAFSGSGSVYAAGSGDGKVRLSADTGATWSRPYPLPAPDPVNGLAVFAGSILATTAHGIWRLSPDSAWTDFPLPGADTLLILGSGPNALLVATSSHLWEMRADGSYADRSSGIAPFKVLGTWILDDRLFAYTSDGVLHRWSAAQGSWQASGEFDRHVIALAGSGDFLAATTYLGFHLSTDGGSTWWRSFGAPDGLQNLAYADGCFYGGDTQGGVWAMRMTGSGTSDLVREPGRTWIRRTRAFPDGLRERNRRIDGRLLKR